MVMFLLLALMPEPEPAYFQINIETNTNVSLFIKGQEIKPGVTYKTEPLYGPTTVEVEIRYISGGEVKTIKKSLDLDPGYKINFTLELFTIPPLVLAC